MTRKWKIALFAIGGGLALLVLAAVALILFVDVNAHKPRLEAAASEALGMDVRIGGRMGIGLFPGVHVAMEDVRIRNRGADVASAKEVSFEIALRPLLHKEVRIVKIGIVRPRISVERDRDGTFNFEKPEEEGGKKPAEVEGIRLALEVATVSLSDGTFSYADRKTGGGPATGAFTLDVSRLRLSEGKGSDLLKRLSFTAELACKEVRKGGLAISNLKLRIEGKNGIYGIHPATADRLNHSGPGGTMTADRIALRVDRLAVGDDHKAGLLRRISFAGTAGIGEILTEDFTVSDLKLKLGGKGGIFYLGPMTMRLFGGHGSGGFHVDLSGSAPLYRVRYSLSKFRIEMFLKTLSPKTFAEGPMDFSATLSMRGKTASELKRTAQGAVSLGGENLTINGTDLDRELSRYESSQNFNLVDVGAFFVAGPFAPLVTRGYKFAGLFQGSGGSSRIRRFISQWKVERGVAQATDVAMATNENRIALKGRLDFVHDRFDDVTVAMVDGKGCAKVRQKIRGPFRKPEVEKPNVLQSTAGPVLNLFKKAKKLFGGKCEVFYAGSVAPHP